MAIQTGLSLTAKRMSVASAWRVAMATTVPFHLQWSSSPVQRSVTLKSSYMVGSRLVQQGGMGKAAKNTGTLARPLNLFEQPYPCQSPIALHRPWSNPQDTRDLFDREPTEVAKLNNPGLSRIQRLKPRKRLIQHQYLFGLVLGYRYIVIHFHSHEAPSAHGRLMGS